VAESSSTRAHKAEAPKSLGFGVLVISTGVSLGTRFDTSGALIAKRIAESGHKVAQQNAVPDDVNRIRIAIIEMAHSPDVQVLVTTGGTGLTRQDVTYEAVKSLFTKELTGFNPVFMLLSYLDVGSSALLSRALAGTVENKCVIFCLPGSPAACELAMDKIILPEAAHIVKHVLE
jgi:molybdenum cofactor biosynthesis protein B